MFFRGHNVGQTSASYEASLHLLTEVILCILTTYFILVHTLYYALPTVPKIISPKSSFLSPIW